MTHPQDPRVPRPLQSPDGPRIGDDEPVTGSHYIPAMRSEVKEAKRYAEALVEAREAVAHGLAKAKRVKNFIWATAGIVIATIGITVSTLSFAQGKIDAGVRSGIEPVAVDLKRTEARVDRIEPALQQLSLEQARTSAGVDMLLRKEGIRPLPPVPPLALDGGR